MYVCSVDICDLVCPGPPFRGRPDLQPCFNAAGCAPAIDREPAAYAFPAGARPCGRQSNFKVELL